MKIYNKKKFAFGVGMTVLGTANLILDIVNNSLDVKSVIIILALFLFGIGDIMRSLSQKMSREDKVDELDERNQFIALKSKSKAFRLTQIISFILMVILLVAGKTTGYDGFIAIAVGLAFSFSISMFSEIFAYFHYETKN